MNKRIREPFYTLLWRASVGHNDSWSQVDPEVLEKFGELIVNECANQCDLLLDHKISSEWARGTHDCSKAIRKHFGVE